jgi:non-ribosomal peptide synthetase component F
VNTACNGRQYDELGSALRLLTKYIPIRSHLDAEFTFDRLLEQVETSIRDAGERQELFFPKTSLDWANNCDRTSGDPFGFEFEDWSVDCAAGGASFSIEQMSTYIDRFKIRLSCVRRQDEWMAVFHYDSNTFLAADIQRLAAQFQTLITHAIAQPQAHLDRLDILSETERQQLLFEFNPTHTEISTHWCLHQLFEAQVEQTPDRIAIIFGSEFLTYTQLNSRANQLAHYLWHRGVTSGVRVGICLERGVDAIVAILGILKAGGSYIPLDPTYPKDRLAHMLENGCVSVQLTHQHLLEKLPPNRSRVICLNVERTKIDQENAENLVGAVAPQNLAYVMYTSGSTGKPKGVAMSHASVVKYVRAINTHLQVTAEDVYLHTASFSFSSSIRQLFVPLSQGASLVLATTEQTRDPLTVFEVIQKHRVSSKFNPVVLAPPSRFFSAFMFWVAG